ncbi:MAG: hypothetical protein ACRDCA_20560 [Serratia sp. (in: enterobacteria)]|uniref:hypothetical protein n=1 Tax=Serratia sp. (in: enterobacteria) TaxID=616 RepID=UPI003F2C8D5C
MRKIINIAASVIAFFIASALLKGACVWASGWYAAPANISHTFVILSCCYVVAKLVFGIVNYFYPK